MKHFKYRMFWTIWAFGWHAQKSYDGKRFLELQIFIGPFALTWWR
jgi:hypothetical protein